MSLIDMEMYVLVTNLLYATIINNDKPNKVQLPTKKLSSYLYIFTVAPLLHILLYIQDLTTSLSSSMATEQSTDMLHKSPEFKDKKVQCDITANVQQWLICHRMKSPEFKDKKV